MSIATALTALNTDITNARNKIAEMGGAVTPNGGTSQLSADIATIPQGGGITIKHGTIRPNSDVKSIVVETGIQNVKAICVFCDCADPAELPATSILKAAAIKEAKSNYTSETMLSVPNDIIGFSSGTLASLYFANNSIAFAFNGSTVQVGAYQQYLFRSTHNYDWVAYGWGD